MQETKNLQDHLLILEFCKMTFKGAGWQYCSLLSLLLICHLRISYAYMQSFYSKLHVHQLRNKNNSHLNTPL